MRNSKRQKFSFAEPKGQKERRRVKEIFFCAALLPRSLINTRSLCASAPLDLPDYAALLLSAAARDDDGGVGVAGARGGGGEADFQERAPVPSPQHNVSLPPPV